MSRWQDRAGSMTCIYRCIAAACCVAVGSGCLVTIQDPPDGTQASGEGRPLSDYTAFKNAGFGPDSAYPGSGAIFENKCVPPDTNGFHGQGDPCAIPWSDGSGIFEIATPYGPGFRFVQYEEVPQGEGVLIADVDHLVDRQNYLGTVFDLSGKFMLPSSGNPNGFPPSGGLWKFSTDSKVSNGFGVDGISNRIYVSTYKADATDGTVRYASANEYKPDQWYDFRWQIKWSEGSDGFMNFWLDGKRVATHTGATLPHEGGIYIEWGWSGGNDPQKNEVRFGALRINP
jgi:Polysaccharide lyase